MNYQEMHNEKDMLEGNINRMFVTDNIDELCNMYMFAKERLDTLFRENCKRIIEKNTV